MSDITKNQLYITQLSRVVETNLTKRYIPMDKPHSRDTFLYILSGTCIFTIDNGEVFQIRAGDVVYLAKNQDYSLEVTSDTAHTRQQPRTVRAAVSQAAEGVFYLRTGQAHPKHGIALRDLQSDDPK